MRACIILIAFISLVYSTCTYSPYRPISGRCNNPVLEDFGASGQPWYDFGVGFVDRFVDNLPPERTISNHLYAIEVDPINRYDISLGEVFFGQFLNHDQELNVDNYTNIYPIAVTEENDLLKLVMGSNFSQMNLSYSMPYNSTPFTFINGQTSYLDLSGVYGRTDSDATALRAHVDGLLAVKNYTVCVYNGNPPPFGNGTCTNETHDIYEMPASQAMTDLPNDLGLNDFNQSKDELLSCGDTRCNENIALSLMHIIWLREHNRNARMLKAQNGSWDDEMLYNEARQLTIAVYQSVIFKEYLPAIIGKEFMKSIAKSYTGYNNQINPGTSHIFAGAAFRYGHSSLKEYYCLDKDGKYVACIPEWTPASYNFPQNVMPVIGSLGPAGYTILDMIYNAGGLENVVYSLVKQQAAEIDNYMDNSFRNLGIGFNPLDIPAADIARGRINGLPDYHKLRASFYYPIYGNASGCTFNSDKLSNDSINCFLGITTNATAAQKLRDMYGRIDRIDPIVGMFFEDHVLDSPVGPTMGSIILKEYERKRDGDRYYYENLNLTAAQLDYINNRTMVNVTNDNVGTNITSFFHVADNVPRGTTQSVTSTSATSTSAASSTSATSSSASTAASTSSQNVGSSNAQGSTSNPNSSTGAMTSKSSTSSSSSSGSIKDSSFKVIIPFVALLVIFI